MDEINQDEQRDIDLFRENLQIGREAEAFKTSALGQYVLTKANEQRQQLIEALLLADPHEWKTVQDLQIKIVALGTFEGWLDQAIQDGLYAQQIFNNLVE